MDPTKENPARTLNRREFLRKSSQVAALAFAGTACGRDAEPPNILLITGDDMSFDSLGLAGCEMPGITPHLDHFASQGAYLPRAHVNVARCHPSRSALMTGRFPHRSGGIGDEPVRPDVPTLGKELCAAGYTNAIFCKEAHLAPFDRHCWHKAVSAREFGGGRDPRAFYRHTAEFVGGMQARRSPFFLMVNSVDPHRPFNEPFRRRYEPRDAQIPPFLPDLPTIREELALYYSAVHRMDETVGSVLRALDDVGAAENTLVVFLSDNSMAFPFAKANCYPHSTLVPLIVRFPGRIRPGGIETEAMISGVDLMPTLLEAVGLEPPAGLDGRSFLPGLTGKRETRRDRVYTYLFSTMQAQVPMRAVLTPDHAFVFNPWSDGEARYKANSSASASYRAMKKAARSDPALAARLRFYRLRAREELYARASDPFSLRNLAADPEYAKVLAALRDDLAAHLHRTGDPALPDFERYLESHQALAGQST